MKIEILGVLAGGMTGGYFGVLITWLRGLIERRRPQGRFRWSTRGRHHQGRLDHLRRVAGYTVHAWHVRWRRYRRLRRQQAARSARARGAALDVWWANRRSDYVWAAGWGI